MTATPLIKDQTVVSFPTAGAVRTDAASVGSSVFADIFAEIDVMGLRGLDRQGDRIATQSSVPDAGIEKSTGRNALKDDTAPYVEIMHRAKAGLVVPETSTPSDMSNTTSVAVLAVPEGHFSIVHDLDLHSDTTEAQFLVPVAGIQNAMGGDLLKGDTTPYVEMRHRAKAGLVVPETSTPSDIHQNVNLAIHGASEALYSDLYLVGEEGVTDVPVDVDQSVAYLARLLTGKARASEANASVSDAKSDQMRLEKGVPPEAGGNILASSSVEMTFMQVDGHLVIMFSGTLRHGPDDLAAYDKITGLETSVREKRTEQAAPLMWADEQILSNASASPVVTATMTMIPPGALAMTVTGQVRTAFALAGTPIEKSLAPFVRLGYSGALPSQENDTFLAGFGGNSTVKPFDLSGAVVSGNPVIGISGVVSEAKLADTYGEVLRDGATFQPSLSGVRSKPGALLASLPRPHAEPAAEQVDSVTPTAERDLRYLDIARYKVVPAAPLVVGANMKTWRMRGLEQSYGQQSELRPGLVSQALAVSDNSVVRTADHACAGTTKLSAHDVPAHIMSEWQRARAQDHRGTGHVARDIAVPTVGQSGTQPVALTSGTASAAPMVQSNGLSAILDVRRQGWTRTLVQRAGGMVQSGGVLTLKILPQHLGQITLKMSEGRRGLDLRIVTEVASTAAMLRGVESQISSAFEGAGLMLGEFSANTGKGGGTAFGDSGEDGDAALAGGSDADESDLGIIDDQTAQHSLLNIIL